MKAIIQNDSVIIAALCFGFMCYLTLFFPGAIYKEKFLTDKNYIH